MAIKLKPEGLSQLPSTAVHHDNCFQQDGVLLSRKEISACKRNPFLQTAVPGLTHSFWIFGSLGLYGWGSEPGLIVPWLLTVFHGKEEDLGLGFSSATIFKSYLRHWKMEKGPCLLWRNMQSRAVISNAPLTILIHTHCNVCTYTPVSMY